MPLFLTSLATRFLALPKWLRNAIYVALGALALWLAFTLWLHFHDRSIIREHEAEITEQVGQKTRAADAAATEASDRTVDDIAAGNQRASEAAKDSDDPLADGLRELRK